MLRILSWLITVPIIVIAVLFALSNRDPVSLRLWPLPFEVDAPLYLASLLFLLAGFLAGGFSAWVSGHRHRAAARKNAWRAEKLERELADARDRAAQAEKRVAELTRPQPSRGAAPLPVPVDPAAKAIAAAE